MKHLPFKNIGDSDSGLMFTNFQHWFMGAPTVVIERPLNDVLESLESLFGKRLCDEGDMEGILLRQAEALKSVSGLRVAFDDINDRIQEIHEYLVSVPFDKDYAQDMIEENRQVTELNVDIDSYQMWVGGQ
jgi:hypothetical protein